MTDTNNDGAVLGRGALPSLNESLKAPVGEVREKTNVKKLTVLAMVICSFLFALVAMMLWTKTRPVSDARQNAAVPEIPGYTQKNVDVESDSIDDAKAKIRRAEEEKAAREAKIQAELDEMARKAREDEEARRRLLAPARAPASAPATAIAETPEALAMRSNVLLPVTGSPSRGGNERGSGASSGSSSPGGV
ncbi:MAG: hypothetical protein LBU43_01600 [Candidatus Accumulibacter sp.]|jgi:hypothetical protein|nr:hypothetical protein [Accumulibacter sp.]